MEFEEDIEAVNREKYMPYNSMDFSGLALAWQLIPRINDDFPDVWTFVCVIAAIFPDSPVKEMANNYIDCMAQELIRERSK